MAKYFTIVFILSVVVSTLAQYGGGFYGGAPSYSIDKAADIQSKAFQQIIDRINNSTTLPVDLQEKAVQVVMDSQQNFDVCKDLLTATQTIWHYKKCTAFELRNVLLSISAIQREASLRAAQPTTSDV